MKVGMSVLFWRFLGIYQNRFRDWFFNFIRSWRYVDVREGFFFKIIVLFLLNCWVRKWKKRLSKWPTFAENSTRRSFEYWITRLEEKKTMTSVEEMKKMKKRNANLHCGKPPSAIALSCIVPYLSSFPLCTSRSKSLIFFWVFSQKWEQFDRNAILESFVWRIENNLLWNF